MSESHPLKDAALSVEDNTHGAEIQDVTDTQGKEASSALISSSCRAESFTALCCYKQLPEQHSKQAKHKALAHSASNLKPLLCPQLCLRHMEGFVSSLKAQQKLSTSLKHISSPSRCHMCHYFLCKHECHSTQSLETCVYTSTRANNHQQ